MADRGAYSRAGLDVPFDKVCILGLIYKLIQLPPQLVKILHSYLTHRSFSARVKTSVSTHNHILVGVPDDFLLEPKLFNLYINNILTKPDVTSAVYADDTAVLIQHRNIHSVVNSLQNSMSDLSAWFRRWGIKFNPHKSAAVIFTNGRYNPTPLIFICPAIPFPGNQILST